MAAAAAYHPTNQPPSSTAVISPQYCAPYPVDLTIARKLIAVTEGNFAVTDVNGNLLFRVRGKLLTIRDRRVLLDASGKPLITFRQKLISAHRTWKVYRGDSTSSKDYLFSVKKSSLFQYRTRLDVFLAHGGRGGGACDYRIEGSWLKRSCVVYAGSSNTVVAQMHRKITAQSYLLGKDTFGVTVYPNVDYAFIVALVVILQEINADRTDED